MWESGWQSSRGGVSPSKVRRASLYVGMVGGKRGSPAQVSQPEYEKGEKWSIQWKSPASQRQRRMRISVWVGVSNMSRVRKVSTWQESVLRPKWNMESVVTTVVPCPDIPSKEPAKRSRTAWQPPATSPWNPLQHSHLAMLPLGFCQQKIEHDGNVPIANSGRSSLHITSCLDICFSGDLNWHRRHPCTGVKNSGGN